MTIVDSEISLIALLDSIENLPTNPPSLYFDIEGVHLSRHGSISIIQLYVLPIDHTYLIDVHTLHQDTFHTVNGAGKSLKVILESELVPKVFFDVRNDSDALFSHFQVRLRGVRDVQLMEVATRSFSKRLLSGLAVCIERDANFTLEEKQAWKATKESGTALFAPENGGSYEVFNVRPIPSEIIRYCTQDVTVLPSLWSVYSDKLSSKWAKKVLIETGERVRISQSASYDPKGKDKSLSPWGKPPPKKKKMQDTKAPIGNCTMDNPSLRPVVQPGTDRLKELNSGPWKEPSTETGLPSITNPSSYWICAPCSRKMLASQKEVHLRGKPHINNLKAQSRSLTANSPADLPISSEQVEPVSKTATPKKKNNRNSKPKASAGVSVPSKQTLTTSKSPRSKTRFSASTSRLVATHSPPRYSSYDPNYASRSAYGTSYMIGDNQNWGLCDKDCGWCGHCMDGMSF